MMAGYTPVGSAVVRANSDIYKVSDLKGKTVAIADAYPSIALNAQAVLAFGGLTPDDVKVVRAGSYSNAIEMLGEGVVDACASNVTTRKVVELAATPAGIRFLPLPHDDTKGWERFWKIRPQHKKVVYDKGLMEGKPLEMFAALYMLLTMDFQSEDFVYTVARAIHQNYPKFKDKVTPLGTEQVTMERTLDLETFNRVLIPYHPGLIKLAKELGLWKQQHDEYQAKAIRDQEHWIAAWKTKYGK
jgi:TRAP transporter TAXI family solute receptor